MLMPGVPGYRVEGKVLLNGCGIYNKRQLPHNILGAFHP
jgi:hypothetical protein